MVTVQCPQDAGARYVRLVHERRWLLLFPSGINISQIRMLLHGKSQSEKTQKKAHSLEVSRRPTMALHNELKIMFTVINPERF